MPFNGASLGEDNLERSLKDLGLGPRSLLILVPGQGTAAWSGGTKAGSTMASHAGILGAIWSALASFLASALSFFFGGAPRHQEAEGSRGGGGHRNVYDNGNSTMFSGDDDDKKNQ